MALDRKVFFDRVRKAPFGGSLSQETVQGCNAILDEWDRRALTDLRHLAYMLATVRGECGPDMLPVREGFSKTDASARAYVTRQGYRYAVERYGHVWYGRGLVQLTHYENYFKLRAEILAKFKVDVVANPDAVLRPDIAAYVMFEGMIRGTFTGKKLRDYLLPNGRYAIKDKEGRESADLTYRECRRIINGTDKAAQFATWAMQFYSAILAASASSPIPQPPPPDIPKPKPADPAKGGWLAAILRLFGRRS